eukprot:15018_1
MNKIICALFASYQLSFGQNVIPGNPNYVDLPPQAQAGAHAVANPFICNLPCTTTANCPSECAQGVFNFAVPNYWEMELNAAGSGAASVFNINFPAGVTHMESLKITTMYATYGATFNFHAPNAGGEAVYVREITCGQGLCVNTVFVFGLNVEFGDLKCHESGCGDGCIVTFHEHGA